MAFSSAVIGLGNVGMGYDYDLVDRTRVLTHASAYHYHPKFDLVAGVDPDPSRRARFEEKFSAKAFRTVTELYENVSPEVISVAVPTKRHYEVFSEVISHDPKGLVMEKPMAETLSECRKIVATSKDANCRLVVNFMRRYEPSVLKLLAAFRRGEFGKIVKGIVWYSGEIIENGAHALDLLIMFLGPVSEVQRVSLKASRKGSALSPDLVVQFEETCVYFVATGVSEPAMMEIELIGMKGSVRYLDSGERIAIRKIKPDPLFPGCYTLQRKGATHDTDLGRYQWHVLEFLGAQLESGHDVNMREDEILETAVALDAIVQLFEVPEVD